MPVDIVGIGATQKKYPNPEEREFETLSDYLGHAQRIIGYFAPRIRGGLSREMLASEDAIANVANAIMIADWTWDEKYTGKNGKVCSRHTYRNLRGIWAIKSYLVRRKRRGKYPVSSINTEVDEEGGQLYSILSDESSSPLDRLLHSEMREVLEEIISCGIITERQEEYVRLHYFDSMSFSDIGKQHGVSRQAVHDAVTRAINKLGEQLEKS